MPVTLGPVRSGRSVRSVSISWDDVVKYLLAGADVVMTTSSLLRHGIAHMGNLNDQRSQWLESRGLDSLDDIRGKLSHANVADPEAFERANYIKILQGYSAK